MADAAGIILGAVISGLLWVGGLGLLGLQIYWFLHDGAWTSLSIIDALRSVDITPWGDGADRMARSASYPELAIAPCMHDSCGLRGWKLDRLGGPT
jgi:hypothetical protein